MTKTLNEYELKQWTTKNGLQWLINPGTIVDFKHLKMGLLPMNNHNLSLDMRVVNRIITDNLSIKYFATKDEMLPANYQVIHEDISTLLETIPNWTWTLNEMDNRTIKEIYRAIEEPEDDCFTEDMKKCLSELDIFHRGYTNLEIEEMEFMIDCKHENAGITRLVNKQYGNEWHKAIVAKVKELNEDETFNWDYTEAERELANILTALNAAEQEMYDQ